MSDRLLASCGTHSPRKHYLSEATYHCHLKGIGGAGAPHVMALDRMSDLQARGLVPAFDLVSCGMLPWQFHRRGSAESQLEIRRGFCSLWAPRGLWSCVFNLRIRRERSSSRVGTGEIREEDVDSAFWRRRRVDCCSGDVLLRTGRRSGSAGSHEADASEFRISGGYKISGIL